MATGSPSFDAARRREHLVRRSRILVSIGLVAQGLLLAIGHVVTPTYDIVLEFAPLWAWSTAFIGIGVLRLATADRDRWLAWKSFLTVGLVVTWALCLAGAAIWVADASSTAPVPWLMIGGLTVLDGYSRGG